MPGSAVMDHNDRTEKLRNGLRHRGPVKEPVAPGNQSPGPRKGSWPRVFRNQPSLNDQLTSSDQSFQIVRDVAMVHIVLFIAYILVRDLAVKGKGLSEVTWFFSGLGSPGQVLLMVAVELSLLATALLVHPLFKAWQVLRTGLPPSLVDSLFLALYCGYIASSAAYICWTIASVQFSTSASAVLTIEQLRLSMKTYSFLRENAYKVLYPWKKDDQSGPARWYDGQVSPEVGGFGKYLFFLFAPTLLYRDHYPRNPGPVNWRNVVVYLVQFVLSMWCVSLICSEFIFPRAIESDTLVLSYIASLVCVFPITLLGHTCILHSYLNVFCELFRFADRQFYGDWWTSTSFSTFYRKWNMLVYDWLYSYIYKDVKNVTGKQWLAVFATLHISAVIHEYIVSVALGFAIPLLFIEFAVGGLFMYFFHQPKIGRLSNILLLIMHGFGSANLIFHYQTEFAARLYCPRQVTVWEFFIPRMWDCYQQSLNHSLAA